MSRRDVWLFTSPGALPFRNPPPRPRKSFFPPGINPRPVSPSTLPLITLHGCEQAQPRTPRSPPFPPEPSAPACSPAHARPPSPPPFAPPPPRPPPWAQPTFDAATARNTPFTNADESSVDSSETSWTASEIATASGTSP